MLTDGPFDPELCDRVNRVLARERERERESQPKQRLIDKYRPKRIRDFLGLENVKKVLIPFAAQPYPSAWLFRGPSGVGKTSMAMALALEIGLRADDVYVLPGPECNVDRVKAIRHDLRYRVPHHFGAPWYFYLVDEADEIPYVAYIQFLSVLQPPDGLSRPAIFVFTANSPEKVEQIDKKGNKHVIINDKLERKFRSRCMQLEFHSHGLREEIAGLLSRVWTQEAPQGATPPNFLQLAHDAQGNVRDALQDLQKRITPL